jgi:hypothetical protein
LLSTPFERSELLVQKPILLRVQLGELKIEIRDPPGLPDLLEADAPDPESGGERGKNRPGAEIVPVHARFLGAQNIQP